MQGQAPQQPRAGQQTMAQLLEGRQQHEQQGASQHRVKQQYQQHMYQHNQQQQNQFQQAFQPYGSQDVNFQLDLSAGVATHTNARAGQLQQQQQQQQQQQHQQQQHHQQH
mmetsp:Transcript_11475/g.21271  ORF Transcript_11475/g.21271 Transcript_11475/m.21271 type:complete len:110 (+) Transcript_11475:534-863(+)